MGRTMTSLLAIGIGAAAYSMSNQRTKRRINRFVRPITNLDMNKIMNMSMWKNMQRGITRTFS